MGASAAPGCSSGDAEAFVIRPVPRSLYPAASEAFWRSLDEPLLQVGRIFLSFYSIRVAVDGSKAPTHAFVGCAAIAAARDKLLTSGVLCLD